jgi:hypothetical protein
MEDFGNLLAAGLLAFVAYGIMRHPACDAACKQIFGAAGAEAGKVAAASAIGLMTASALQSTRR